MKRILLILLLLCNAYDAFGQNESIDNFFIPNKNQWGENDPSIARVEIPQGMIYIHSNKLRFYLTNPEDAHKKHLSHHFKGKDTQFTVQHEVFDIFFGDSTSESNRFQFQNFAPFYYNFFLSNNPKNQITKLYPCRELIILNVYPQIDVKLYFNNQKLELDWILKKGANPNHINISIPKEIKSQLINNNIEITSHFSQFIIQKPIAYQSKKSFKSINCRYVKQKNNLYGFKIGSYDTTQNLIIDPILVFSTYSGSKADNFGFTATYDTSGCLYAGGIVDASTRTYPVTTGAFQTTYGGSGAGNPPVGLACDISISKYSPDGLTLLYATYLGGSDDEYPHSLIVNPKNQLVIFGTTLSLDFPIKSDTTYQKTHSGDYDIFIDILSQDGSKLIAGTFMGGNDVDGFQSDNFSSELIYNYADNYRGDIATDQFGNIYIATCTRSTDFPVSPGAYQKKISGETDAVVFSLSPNLRTLRWASLYGGLLDDAAYSIKIDDSSRVFVGGGTRSANFPIQGNTYQKTASSNNVDGFIIRIDQNTGAYQLGTYWGTSMYDQIYFIDLDANNNVYFTGQTEGSVNRTIGTYGKDNTSQFIGKFNLNLSKIEFITTFGYRTNGIPELSPSAFMVDECYNIYFSGWGCDIGVGNAGTTFNLPVTADAHQKTTDRNDFYLIVLGKNANNLKYASYFGGNKSEDHVDGGTSRFDNRGIIYQSVCASCPNRPPGLNDFPTSPANVAFKNNVSIRCSNASFKLDFRLGYSIDALFASTPKRFCLESPVNFQPFRFFPKATYTWYFGDGDSSNSYAPTHTYKDTGKFIVKLIVVDSLSCNARAVYQDTIQGFPNPIAKLKYTDEPCEPGIKLQATTKYADSITWILDYQHDTITKSSSTTEINYQYPLGVYWPKIITKNNQSGCKSIDSIELHANTDSTLDVLIANVFTPNNDGKNDCFRIFGISNKCDEAEVFIFNRWGERIYYSKDLDNCWNGKVNNIGPELPSGTYFYQLHLIKTRNAKLPEWLEGTINLLR